MRGKKIICVVLALVIIGVASAAFAYEVTRVRTPAKCYTLFGERVPTWTNLLDMQYGRPSDGYIDPGDLCTIIDSAGVDDNNWAKVIYPVPGGSKTAYTQLYRFVGRPDDRSYTFIAKENCDVYSSQGYFGYIEAGDEVLIVGWLDETGCVVVYPVPGGYKLGTIEIRDYHRIDPNW